ncbi:hypothetical protein [Streptosporangium roseum]|uniref:Uncharacterized protein n=1 Tax=Streptosporangium roseum (strain ATCC 12428 / DSM 43021 / JCM 3005 / KCTC 9067 / NCIMB 10171 / NRRL 2505 / NI 9100) TaxID=479432 RepID=D2B4M6_STRRD|nr:hypothetical protein [Streptosporangium roseum]ACZ83712.1 hypothetical protein Sros_0689 [Streptosporangium roseum DSM 43021]
MVRRSILVAPVTVSPTKPLTPTHLKHLLSFDVLCRATALFADVHLLYNHSTFAGTRQVAGFWEFLDRVHPALCYQDLTEERIGELYMEHQRSARVPFSELQPVVQRAENGWIHPATSRILEIWEQHYRLLGMSDIKLGGGHAELAPVDEVVETLTARHLCVDGRPLGAPVYLDATPAGLPLRVVISADGHANYLFRALQELIPSLGRHDLVLLVYDKELRHDYLVLEHVLCRLGAAVERLELVRVPIDGEVRSSREGGWQGYTIGGFAEPVVAEFGQEAFRLGLRLYLLAGLGRGQGESFSLPHLKRWVRRAQRLLDTAGEGTEIDAADADVETDDLPSQLSRLAGRRGFIDSYRLTTNMLTRAGGIPLRELLRVAYV